jgi:hypothetical protein
MPSNRLPLEAEGTAGLTRRHGAAQSAGEGGNGDCDMGLDDDELRLPIDS